MSWSLSAGPVETPSTNSVGDTVVITLPDVNAGDLIVVGIYWVLDDQFTVSTVTCPGEADFNVLTGGAAGTGTPNFHNACLAYLLPAASSGTKTITVTLSSSGAIHRGAWAAAFTPTSTNPALTDLQAATGTSATATVNLTTIKDNELIVSQVFTEGTDNPAAGTGYTLVGLTESNSHGAAGEYDLDVGTAGVKTVDFTFTSAKWAITAVSFEDTQDAIDFTHTPFGGAEGTGASPWSGVGAASFAALTAVGAGVEGTAGDGRATFEPLTAEGTGLVPYVGEGVGVFEAMIAVGYGPNVGEASFEPMTATGQATQGGVGVASFKPLEVYRVEGIASFQPLAAVGYGHTIVSDAYTTKVVNLRTGAVTEFTNYQYNSFARIGTKYFGAGPAGLVRLEGTTDPSNANINWHVKTGQMDNKDPGLKRLPEVVLGLRASDKITVRVHPDDNTSHNYELPVVQTNTIHQHRVKPGKGMRGRWFAVALLGNNNTTLELDSMQVNMTKTTRRLG